MKPQIVKSEKQDGKRYIVLSGALIFKYHKELFAIFNEINQEADAIELQLDRPAGIDLSFLQMLMALKKEKAINVSASLQEADEVLIKNTGFGALFK